MTQQVQRSPGSHHGTGVSGPHQEASIPPGKSTQPRPQRSQSPVMTGTDVYISSLSPQDPISTPNPYSLWVHHPPQLPNLKGSGTQKLFVLP